MGNIDSMENIDLKAALETGLVTFKFKKANGEVRSASGTRMLNSSIALGYSEEHKPKGVRKEIEGVITFWDIDKGAWRSCRTDSIISIDMVSTEAELLGGNLFEEEE
jgi:hypothetical protein